MASLIQVHAQLGETGINYPDIEFSFFTGPPGCFMNGHHPQQESDDKVKAYKLGLIIITLGVSLARIGVGVHYLSDVVAGLSIGAITALAGVMLSQYFFLL